MLSMFPEQKRFFALSGFTISISAIGTGFIWASVGQGSGELIFWPYLIAKYGLSFVGWILPACVLQFWVNSEIGRYTILSGETIFAGFKRLHPIFVWILGLLIIPCFLWFGAYASAGGTALAALTDFPAGWGARAQSLFWAYTTIALFVSFILARVIYRALERFMIIVSIVCLIGILIAVFHPRVSSSVGPYFGAYFSTELGLPDTWDPKDSIILLTAVTFAGMGGFFNIFYSYWLRDKGVGMSGATDPSGIRQIGQVTSPIRGFRQPIPSTGAFPKDTPENKKIYRTILRGFHIDNAIGVGINLVTVSLLGLLAYATLYPQGAYPSGWQIAVVQSEFFQISWGNAGKILFLAIAALFLADTWPGVVDGVSRMFADAAKNVGLFSKTDFKSVYWMTAGALVVISCITLPLAAPATLLLLQGIFNFLAMVIYCPLLIWLSFFKAPRIMPSWVRPSRFALIGISVSTVVYYCLFVWYVWVQLG